MIEKIRKKMEQDIYILVTYTGYPGYLYYGVAIDIDVSIFYYLLYNTININYL